MDWARILAYVTGTVDQELLARNEYLAAENRIMKAQLKGRPECSVSEAPIAPAQGPAATRSATQREFEARSFPSATTFPDNCLRGRSGPVKSRGTAGFSTQSS